VRATSLMATHSGTVVLAVRWWLEGYDLGAHDEEGSQAELSVPPNRRTVVKWGAARAKGVPGLNGMVGRKAPN
jgi:hypothetical protein